MKNKFFVKKIPMRKIERLKGGVKICAQDQLKIG